MILLRSCYVVLVLCLSLGLAFAGPPKTFQKTGPSQWITFEIRDGVDFQHAWDSTFDILIKDFDLDLVLKDDGYVRTQWLYAYGEKYDFQYRLRLAVRFAPDRKSIRVKPEAHYKDGENWVMGVDSRLINTFKTDLMGTIGRITR
jgi:hypothetical protein